MSGPDVEHLTAQFEELKHRLDDLEERQDFAERLLARRRDRTALRPGAAEE